MHFCSINEFKNWLKYSLSILFLHHPQIMAIIIRISIVIIEIIVIIILKFQVIHFLVIITIIKICFIIIVISIIIPCFSTYFINHITKTNVVIALLQSYCCCSILLKTTIITKFSSNYLLLTFNCCYLKNLHHLFSQYLFQFVSKICFYFHPKVKMDRLEFQQIQVQLIFQILQLNFNYFKFANLFEI